MTIKSTVVTVEDTATRLDTVADNASYPGASSIAVYNDGDGTIYIGGADVTSTNGVPIPADTWGPGIDLRQGEALYGIVATGTQSARVLEQGV